jgi:hypothetical protein
MKRTRTGRRIELSARDIELFRLLVRYRYLRSTYLYAFLGGASLTRFKERLGDLFHEGYLDRPREQWEFVDARCRPVVHEIGAGGLQVLRNLVGAVESATFLKSAPRQYRHALMICEALASLELGCRQSGLRFVACPEILAKAPEATRSSGVPWRLPLPSGGYIAPDGVFGIEHREGAAKSYRFFALEADRGTMPVSRTALGQTSYLAKLGCYREVISRGGHREQWSVPNLLVLTLTTSASRLADMLRIGAGNLGPEFLFQATGEGDLLRPDLALLGEPWQRAGHAPFSLTESR